MTGAGPCRAASRALWAGAALAALVLHGAAAASLWRAETQIDDEDGGAVEIAYETTAPRPDASEAPIGPVSSASDAAPDSPQSQPEAGAPPPVEPQVEPQVEQQVERHEEAEATRSPPPPPEREAQNPDAAASSPSRAAIDAEERAPPATTDTREAPVQRAPVIADGVRARREQIAWRRKLVGHFNRHKRYPAGAGGREATTLVSFTLDRLGHVVSAAIARSSGVAALDDAALAMLRRADPVPPPPALVADAGLSFTIPVQLKAHAR